MPTAILHHSQAPLAEFRGGAVSFGNFDGVHRGHAELIHTAKKMAREFGGPTVAVTFDPHPLQTLRPQAFEPPLTTPEERARLLHEVGASHVVILRATPEFLGLSAEEFFEVVVLRQLAAKAVVEGPNFGFGRGRAGSVATLREFCDRSKVRLAIVPALLEGGQTISSSRVRRALEQGNVAEARKLLGRPYRLAGVVGVGQKRGRVIGFPTANLEQVSTLVPGDGVYAVRGRHLGLDWLGAANVGPNPTFGEQKRKLEVHIIDFAGELYGLRVEVQFLHRLRDTKAFAGVQELREQLGRDVAQVRQLEREGRL